MNIVLGKAGRKRWMGRKPHNRGTAMNPIDHPHGGGEGRTKGGRHPVSPTGVLAKGGSHPQASQAVEQGHRPSPQVAALRPVEDQVELVSYEQIAEKRPLRSSQGLTPRSRR